MSFIYTHNTSPRRFKKVIKNKSYYEAVDKQNKLLRSLGIDPHRTIRRDSFKVMPLEQVGKLQTFTSYKSVKEAPTYKSSGTKPVDNIKLEVSKQYTVAPAYNKGPSMVVGKKDIKDIGR
jgi:hypothetical protein|tara:strand:+ start:181 stop:540 length:360 start_codon:yes stop_codon:yes gene_type:complete